MQSIWRWGGNATAPNQDSAVALLLNNHSPRSSQAAGAGGVRQMQRLRLARSAVNNGIWRVGGQRNGT